MASNNDTIYCPICEKTIEASNLEDITNFQHTGMIFLHEDVFHSDEDMEALSYGIQ